MFTAASPSISRTIIGAFGTVVFAGICLMGATAPAQAAEAPRTAIVSTAGLNLATDAGRDAFQDRVRHAAQAVCAAGSDDVRAKAGETRCVKAAVRAAQPAQMASIG